MNWTTRPMMKRKRLLPKAARAARKVKAKPKAKTQGKEQATFLSCASVFTHLSMSRMIGASALRARRYSQVDSNQCFEHILEYGICMNIRSGPSEIFAVGDRSSVASVASFVNAQFGVSRALTSIW